jgi:hypothetical protein
MSGHRYMGPSEVQSLILGKWVSIVGKRRHDDDDRGKYGREREREQEQEQEQ